MTGSFLITLLHLPQVPVDTALQVTCQALTICMSGQAETKDMKAAVSVFLESVPPAFSKQANPKSVKAAATLFSQCCQGRQARTAVKVLIWRCVKMPMRMVSWHMQVFFE